MIIPCEYYAYDNSFMLHETFLVAVVLDIMTVTQEIKSLQTFVYEIKFEIWRLVWQESRFYCSSVLDSESNFIVMKNKLILTDTDKTL